MSEKTKPWHPRHVNMAMRRARTSGRNAVHAMEGVVIPHEDVFLRDPIRQCTRKRPFTVEATAIKEAAKASERAGVPLRAYPCPHCGQWHIGSYRSP